MATPVYSLDEARDAVLALIPAPVSTESIALENAVNRVLAKDIRAQHQVPPFRNSAMDGYAIRYQDSLNTEQFRLAGKSLAGHPFTGNMPANSAVRITTGAALPADADTVVIQENTIVEDDVISFTQAPKAQQHLRNPGDDIAIGQLLIEKNRRLSPADTGLIAAQGIATVDVFIQPRVAVFSTGDELCNAGTPLKYGQIYDSNRTSIRSLLARAGIETTDLGIISDHPDAMQTIMNRGADFDFILSSGGVSVGEADYVKASLENNGELFFWKVAMKPGKPMVTGKLTGGAFYFGLPGNPVSSMVTCVQFVIPAINAFCGQTYQPPISLSAVAQCNLPKEIGRFEFQRACAFPDEKGKLTVTTTGLQDSHVLSSMTKANCFVCLQADSSGANAGDIVEIILFSSLPGLN
ncbi:hypothetical protein AB833_30780 [Chromatiales bacterium (ex Bugula neritina AB1)]|nr:hypothetical protein AB833_30780 [Chromatiales bacterium (ex Bugula neritina AB1)]